jgi:hypothetical protein
LFSPAYLFILLPCYSHHYYLLPLPFLVCASPLPTPILISFQPFVCVQGDLPQPTGWTFFDLSAEFQRQGVPNKYWTACSLNSDYRCSPFLPIPHKIGPIYRHYSSVYHHCVVRMSPGVVRISRFSVNRYFYSYFLLPGIPIAGIVVFCCCQ